MDTSNMTPEEIMELQKQNCIFCKIIKKEIPTYEVYSDEAVVGILDINPANEGHTILMPKAHYQILPQLPDEMIGHVFRVARLMSQKFISNLGSQGTTIFVANGALAGQKAPHFMAHAIPRKKNDMLFSMPKNSLEDKELIEIQMKLGKRLSQYTGKPFILSKSSEEPVKEEKNVSPEPKIEENNSSKVEEKSKSNEPVINKVKEPSKDKLDLDSIANLFTK